MNTTKRLGFAALALGCLLGCSTVDGGQTGSEDNAPCWNVRTSIALDAASPLGFSANDGLGLAAGTHSAVLHWAPESDHPYGPESGDGMIDLTVTSLGTAAYATTDYSKDTAAVQTELGCEPALLTDVSVTLRTAGGAFDETFNTSLTQTMSDTATLNPTILGGHIAGSFAFDPAALGAAQLAQINLNASFTSSGFSGSLAALLEQSSGSSANSTVSALNVPIACWGAQPGCAQ